MPPKRKPPVSYHYQIRTFQNLIPLLASDARLTPKELSELKTALGRASAILADVSIRLDMPKGDA